MREPEAANASAWSAGARLAFRLWAVFFTLCVAPFATAFIDGVTLWRRVADTVGRWAIAHLLGWPEHSAGPRVPGTDFLPDYTAIAVLAAASVVVTIVWSLLDRRRPAYPAAHAWISTATRFVLAALLFWYGWAKLLPAQLGPDVDLALLPRPAGTLTPMNVLWVFMETSRAYTMFAGALEFAGGLLLLTRRTATLGALLSVAAIGNVLVMNIGYDVNVKLTAAMMFLMALSLLTPDASRLARLFLTDETVALAPRTQLFTNSRADRAARAIGAIIGIVTIYWAFTQSKNTADLLAATRGEPLHGVWRVDERTRDGVVAPALLTDESLWRYFVVNDGAVVVSMSEAATAYRATIDAAAGTVNLRPRPQSPGMEGGRGSLAFHFAQPDPEHLHLERVGGGGTLAMSMSRVDASAYSLVNHHREWRW